MMELRKASRQAVKLKLGFSGTSGSGKTMGALRVAYGMIGDWDKIALIDTENGSGELYANQTFTDKDGEQFTIGEYNYIGLNTFHPSKYIEAIAACEKAGMQLIVIDSITHSWEFILALHGNMDGNSFTNWGKVKPIHEALRNKILQSPCHIFTTVRRKQEYEITTNGEGKKSVQKLGLKEITNDGWEYELTVNFAIEQNHETSAEKDRTNLFINRAPFKLTEEVGQELLRWASSGDSDVESLLQTAGIELNNVSSLQELNKVYLKFPQLHKNEEFMGKMRSRKADYAPVVPTA